MKTALYSILQYAKAIADEIESQSHSMFASNHANEDYILANANKIINIINKDERKRKREARQDEIASRHGIGLDKSKDVRGQLRNLRGKGDDKKGKRKSRE